MNAVAVHQRLKAIGTFVRREGTNQEVWKVNDASYSNILIGLKKDGHLRYVTAVAREDQEAKRVPYNEIGNLKTARQAGDPKIRVYNYQWILPAKGDAPKTLVVALGRDPHNLSSYSFKRIGPNAPPQEND